MVRTIGVYLCPSAAYFKVTEYENYELVSGAALAAGKTLDETGG
jgi:hypothetical protein